MNNRENKQLGPGVHPIGHAERKNGKIEVRDVVIGGRNGRLHALSLGTPEYIRRIQEENSKIADPDMRRDEKIFPVQDLPDLDLNQLRERLANIPSKELEPYLRPQEPDPEDINK